jgi:hypothetical protein
MPNEISTEEFSDIVKEFAAYKLGIQGCSAKTVDEYLLDLRTFFRFFQGILKKVYTLSTKFSPNVI